MALGGTLVDTNIFLEILLSQEREADCKSFLQSSSRPLFISDFSLHSIGVILFRYEKQQVFNSFCKDLLHHTAVSSLPEHAYHDLVKTSSKYGLDFDDSYQLLLARVYDYKIATMDQDFANVEAELIHFL